MTVTELLDRLERVRRNGSQWIARCPAHDDHNPSLSIAVGDDGRTLVNCHAGCSTEAICAALGISVGDLFVESPSSNGSREIVASYDYVDESGALLFQAVRFAPKDFRQRRPDGIGGWIWNLDDARRLLYRLPAVLETARAGGTVFVVEGERDVEALERVGLTATTCAMGAGKWRSEYAEQLRGAGRVVVLPDDDEPGRRHAEDVARSLGGIVEDVRIVELWPRGESGADVSDWVRHARTDEERAQVRKLLDDIVARIPVFTGAGDSSTKPAEVSARQAIDGASFIFREPTDLPAIWGTGQAVLWASGEGLMIVGPDGVGKTTVGQQLVLARIGLGAALLGFSVAPSDERVLYIAADRPRQAARSFARMVSREQHFDALRERLIVWRGPLPFDLTETPRRLAAFVHDQGASTVFIDSLKDVALDLVKDEVGSRVNLALQELVADGIEFCVLHHQRKEAQGVAKPKRLTDVYGSRWLTAGMGSVLLLWGEPGDLVVQFSHLKQPAEDVGPFNVVHDHDRGITQVHERVDLERALNAATDGLTAADAASLIFAKPKADRNEIEKARRRLDRLIAEGKADRRDDPDGTARYFVRNVA